MSDVTSTDGAWDRRRWLILGVICLAQLMVVLDITIVNIALPSAQKALGFSTVERQWVVTAYALAFGSLLLFGGRLADLIGSKVTFLTGLIGFAAVSAIGAPAALSLLTTTFSEPKDRGKAFGIFGSIAASAAAVGLVLGVVLAGSSMFCLVYGFSNAASHSWHMPSTYGFLAAGVLLLAVFAWWQTRAASPLLPPRIVLDRNRGGSYLAILIQGAGIFSIFLFLTYYMQQTLGFSGGDRRR